MKHSPIDQPLSDAEFDRLSDFLDQVGASAMSLEGLDGFLAALICGPDMVPPSEYLPHIWGADYVFDTTEKASEIMTLIMRHWNTISNALQRTLKKTDVYLPVLLEDKDGIAHGNDWAMGFMRGVQVHPGSWDALLDNEEDSSNMVAIMLLAHEHDLDPAMRPPPVADDRREALLQNMIASLTWIYRYLEPYRRNTAQQDHPFTTMRRTHPKTGRNDPCFCGSGKKFKFCCDGKDQFLQ
jgi:uncharacterized protein